MSLPLLNPVLTDIPPYVTAGPAPVGGVRLASNENPYGPSPHVLAVLADLGALHRYPDPSAYGLRQVLAAHHGVDVGTVLVGNGATELLDLLARATLGPGQNAVFAHPSFVMYRIAPASMGAEVRAVPLAADGGYDLDAMLAAVDAHTKLVYLANPNNPTGGWLDRGALRRFAEALPAHVVLVVDEAYREYAVAAAFPDGLDLLAVRERIAIVRTFSKCHGLAALRVGYLFASAPVIDALERARLPFNVNTLAQRAAEAALADSTHVRRCRRRNRDELEWLAPRLEALGLRVTPSQANFLLVDLGAADTCDRLRKHGVLVRCMAPYGLPTHARITLGTRSDNATLLRALRDLLSGRSRSAA